ncbi:MAG: thymidine phosphorylase [Clostridia bacterium]|nr:thymidine phosphorylase [Clostridia bacterium]
MRAVDIIIKKRDGGTLSAEEIRFFIDAYTAGKIQDDQAAALMMSIFFRGMDYKETAALTLAMAESGEQVDLSGIKGVKVDKHSTGGIGDKTSMIVAPVTAACGVPVAKMSGRALGFTGGTIDKLESIPGLSTSIPVDKMVEIVNRTGICIAGQTSELAPADKKLYALRDVTGTIESIPLIAASIMSKKIAAGADAIVLDVKYGSGAFMKTKEEAQKLADTMCGIGEEVGRKTVAVLNTMEIPLGMCIGNSIEVKESIDVLKGGGSQDLKEHCIHLAGKMIGLGLGISFGEAEKMAQKSIDDGSALKKFAEMIAAEGGDPEVCKDPDKIFGIPAYSKTVRAEKDGHIVKADAYRIGMAAFTLGAGRAVKTDPFDPNAGVKLIVKCDEEVKTGQELCILYSSKPITEESENWAKTAYIYE